jgi:hypothetical protein
VRKGFTMRTFIDALVAFAIVELIVRVAERRG